MAFSPESTSPGPLPPLRPLVLDTSALLTGKPLPVEGRAVWAPSGLRDEIARGGPEGRALEWLEGRGLRYGDPTPDTRARVSQAARKTGDAARLSETDVDVLALALDVEGEVLTDDYSIQNVAKVLHVPYTPIGARGIREVWTWRYRCRGCRREYPEALPECPVCGSEIRAGRPRPAREGS